MTFITSQHSKIRLRRHRPRTHLTLKVFFKSTPFIQRTKFQSFTTDCRQDTVLEPLTHTISRSFHCIVYSVPYQHTLHFLFTINGIERYGINHCQPTVSPRRAAWQFRLSSMYSLKEIGLNNERRHTTTTQHKNVCTYYALYRPL